MSPVISVLVDHHYNDARITNAEAILALTFTESFKLSIKYDLITDLDTYLSMVHINSNTETAFISQCPSNL